MARKNCPGCKSGLVRVTEVRPVQIGRRPPVDVEHHLARCPSCGASFLSPSEMNRVMAAAGEAIRVREGLLQPQEIVEIRKSLGLFLPEFERLLGVGPKTAIRWEKGTVFPNKSTDALLRLVKAFRPNADFLAALHGVTIASAPQAVRVHTSYAPRQRQVERNLSSNGLRSSAWPATDESLKDVQSVPYVPERRTVANV